METLVVGLPGNMRGVGGGTAGVNKAVKTLGVVYVRG